jgi:hypothetical protein
VNDTAKKGKVPDLDSELPKVKKKKKQPRFLTEIQDSFQSASSNVAKRAPITFNIGVSLILFFFYVSIMITSLPSQPILLLLILPTLYIIISHIRLERKYYKQQQ